MSTAKGFLWENRMELLWVDDRGIESSFGSSEYCCAFA